MIPLISSILLLAWAMPSSEQQNTPPSPCPNVFNYEPPGTEPGRWYGVVNLSTDSTLHSLWLNIVLDSKADIIGNWIGDVTTQDNTDFKIENTKMQINPGPAVAVRFFVQYNTLNKTPRLLAIRLNGREICNANNRLPVTERTESSKGQNTRQTVDRKRLETTSTRTATKAQKPQDTNVDLPQSTLVQGRPTNEGPVYVKPYNTAPSPSRIEGGDTSQQSYEREPRPRPNMQTTQPPFVRQTSKPRPYNPNDYENNAPTYTTGNKRDDSEGEYFTGGIPTFIIPSSSNPSNNANNGRNQCGKVLLNANLLNPLVVNGKPTSEGQWPWQIALYQTQTVDNKYICGGALVSRRHVMTAAHCVAHKNSRRHVNPNTLTVYLGKHNLRTSVDGVQVKFVQRIIIHPRYSESTFAQDLAILELKEPVTYSDWVQPVCLWPDDQIDLQNVVGKKGSVTGWGFDETGVATEELNLVEMPVVDTETCIRSNSNFFVPFTSNYTYCAGFRDGTSVCNGDSGGGMVFKIDNSWYVRGLVSLSVARQNEYRCDPSHYVVFTDLAKFLPWIRENIDDY